jgi:hypothetical protein
MSYPTGDKFEGTLLSGGIRDGAEHSIRQLFSIPLNSARALPLDGDSKPSLGLLFFEPTSPRNHILSVIFVFPLIAIHAGLPHTQTQPWPPIVCVSRIRILHSPKVIAGPSTSCLLYGSSCSVAVLELFTLSTSPTAQPYFNSARA